MKIAVTGGSGFFGSLLVKELLSQGFECLNIDLIKSNIKHPNFKEITVDVTSDEFFDFDLTGVELIFHNIAAVPLLNDKKLFKDTNVIGTKNVIENAIKNRIQKIINTSSSAIFGIPSFNPVNEDSVCVPIDPYGKAKLEAEKLFFNYENDIEFLSIRPRTIIGQERLGIFQILYEWIIENQNIPVLNGGNNIYQFLNVQDLVDFNIMLIDKKLNNSVVNIGSREYQSLYCDLSDLISYSGSKSKVKSINKSLVKYSLLATNFLKLTPLSTYHALMYGESLYFDNLKLKNEFDFKPKYSNYETLIEGFDWYKVNRDNILNKANLASPHKEAVKQRLLKLVPKFI